MNFPTAVTPAFSYLSTHGSRFTGREGRRMEQVRGGGDNTQPDTHTHRLEKCESRVSLYNICAGTSRQPVTLVVVGMGNSSTHPRETVGVEAPQRAMAMAIGLRT